MSDLGDLNRMTFMDALHSTFLRWIRWRANLSVYDWDHERWTTRGEWLEQHEQKKSA